MSPKPEKAKPEVPWKHVCRVTRLHTTPGTLNLKGNNPSTWFKGLGMFRVWESSRLTSSNKYLERWGPLATTCFCCVWC